MQQYDFDAPVERRGTGSLKYDGAASYDLPSDLLSLWVADMDFALPAEVLNAMHQRIDHGVFGYNVVEEPYFDAVNAWLESRHGWSAPAEQFVMTPGVVFALSMAVRAFTQPGDAVVAQLPVYYPFSGMIVKNGRTLANAPLTYDGREYSIDFEQFERVICQSGAKLFLLCNPHNPVGRAWTRSELEELCHICLKHGVVVVSDEIHMDFARPGFSHVSVATLDERLVQNSVICTSAGKSFNLAGLQTSNIVIPDERLRTAFAQQVSACGFGRPNTMGLVATQACYEHGGPWFDQLKDYLEGNWHLLEQRLADPELPLCLVPAQSTYLAWVDCRALGMYGADLERFVQEEAGLWLDCGNMFGAKGDGFVRINIATQRAYLKRALDQLVHAAKKRASA